MFDALVHFVRLTRIPYYNLWLLRRKSNCLRLLKLHRRTRKENLPVEGLLNAVRLLYLRTSARLRSGGAAAGVWKYGFTYSHQIYKEGCDINETNKTDLQHFGA